MIGIGAQIAAEWIDTSTGEVSRGRVAPADRDGVRRFLARFAGKDLEVALEATTGWRFMVEELRRVGAQVHLAEPAETSARKGHKKRAKTDRADRRHLRELPMVDRLPESWIPLGIGALGEGAGFGPSTKPLVIVALAILLVGLVGAVRTLAPAPGPGARPPASPPRPSLPAEPEAAGNALTRCAPR